jgi:16S rRNA (cytosine1402-N4)-methyltransferase
MSGHIPVLLHHIAPQLNLTSQHVYIDGTFGGGGYTRSLLETHDDIYVLGIDRDPDARARADDIYQKHPKRFQLMGGCFSEMQSLLAQSDFADKPVGGIVLDVGVSSFQIDEGHRGFSFQKEGPLDMRMDPESGLPSAADVVNSLEAEALATIFWQYGDEKRSRSIGRLIAEQRPFTTTTELAGAIAKRYPQRFGQPHPATRVFQALRIHVNDELTELKQALNGAGALLAPEGRLVVVSFHSLEDRLVKTFLTEHSRSKVPVSRYQPDGEVLNPCFIRAHNKVITPSDTEIKANIRSRSAKLRTGIRTSYPWEAKSLW